MNSARTAGPIVTGEAPFDSPIRRNHDGADLGSISSTWHVARAAPLRLAKKFSRTYRSNGGEPTTTNSKFTHILYQLKILWGAICVGCQLHAPGAEKIFDQGSFGLRKF